MGSGSEDKVVPIDRGKSPERIAHELNNLLAVAIGQAEYLLHDDGRGDLTERRECLEAIRQAALDARESVRRLQRILKQMPATGEPAPPTPLEAARRRAPARILVIEDQEEVREAMAALLRQAGHHVETAATGADGVQRYHGERFDCVVTDLIMPGLGGLTVSRAIKDYDPEAYVVLLTGSDQTGTPEELRAAGVDRVLVKPLRRAEILGLVERDARSVGRAHVRPSPSE